MKAICQVAHQSPGRIRLQVPGFNARPELVQILMAMILEKPGIVGVRSSPASESLVITFDPAIWTPESLLSALQGKLHVEADEHKKKGSSSPTAPQSEAFPFRSCQVAHAIKGRARLEIPAIKDTNLAHVLKVFLEQQAGIKHVRVNPRAASVIVNYDAITWDAKSLVTLVRAYDPQPDDLERSLTTNREQQPQELLRQPKMEVVLAGSALALSLIGGPVMPLALGLLWFSTRSIAERARRALLQERQLTVEVLDAAAISVLTLQGMFWQVALLNLLLSSSELIRARTQERARKELTDVLDCMTDRAWIRKDGQMISIEVHDLIPGDIVYVFPGERIPVDGLVLGGKALVDQHMLTGESMPVTKVEGDKVYAATVIGEGELQVRVMHAGNETQVARIIQLIESAPLFDTRAQDYARRWANRLVPYSFLGAGILALTGNIPQAAALLVIDYAAGFRVAAPTTIMSAMTKAARHGIFIRGGRHLEQLAAVDAVIFDKTGTLTVGSPEIVEIIPLGEKWSEDDVLAFAAAAEQCLTHPVAVAVINTAEARLLPIPDRDSFEYLIGQGVEAQVNGQTILVGSRRFLIASGVSFDDEAEYGLQQIETRAASPLCIAVEGKLVGLLALADPIRPEAASVIRALHERGIEKIVMLTGDRVPVAEAVAGSLEIDECVAEVFPGDKLAAVQSLQEEGYTVAVIGDGINDSPALAQADVGLAVNGGTALAQETADVVILQGNLHKLIEAIDISREGMALVRQNWDIVRVPNTIGLGLAFTGFIGPLGASLLSDGAALVAGGNALRPLLNGKQPPAEPPKEVESGD